MGQGVSGYPVWEPLGRLVMLEPISLEQREAQRRLFARAEEQGAVTEFRDGAKRDLVHGLPAEAPEA